jgi:hypothetical protein
LQIAADLAAIPGKFDLPIVFGAVDRGKWPQQFPLPEGIQPKERDALCHACGFYSCAIKIEQWMRRNTRDEVCLLVIEDNHNSRFILREAQRHFQGKHPGTSNPPGQPFPLGTIKQDPLFEPKQKSSLLQVADFCAYVLKRMFMNPTDPRYAPFYLAIGKQVDLMETS